MGKKDEIENRNTVPESNKQSLPDRTLDVFFFYRYKNRTSLKTTFCLLNLRIRPTGFEATFATVFVLIYWLREFPLSAVTNRFELRCQLKQLLLLSCKTFLCCHNLIFLLQAKYLMMVPIR